MLGCVEAESQGLDEIYQGSNPWCVELLKQWVKVRKLGAKELMSVKKNPMLRPFHYSKYTHLEFIRDNVEFINPGLVALSARDYIQDFPSTKEELFRKLLDWDVFHLYGLIVLLITKCQGVEISNFQKFIER